MEWISAVLFLLSLLLPSVLLYPALKLKFDSYTALVYAQFSSFFLFATVGWVIHRYIGIEIPWISLLISLFILLVFRKNVSPINWTELGIQLFKFIVLFFSLYILICSYTPMIWGEKLMDMSMLQFFSHSHQLPVMDPWLFGQPLHYYYLGYYLVGKLVRDTGIPPQASYLLSITLFYYLFVIAMGLFVQLKHRSPRLLLAFFSLGISLLPIISLFYSSAPLMRYWSMTRVFYSNSFFIESPLWSYLFQDLHPHLMSAPLLVVTIFLLLKKEKSYFEYLLFSAFVAVSLFINSWDFIFISTLVLFYLIFYRQLKLLVAYIISCLLAGGWVLPIVTGKTIKFGMQHHPLSLLTGVLIFFNINLILLLYFLWRRKDRKELIYAWSVILFSIITSIFFYLFDPTNTIFKFMTSLGIFMLILIVSNLKFERYFVLGGGGLLLFFVLHWTHFHKPQNYFHPLFSENNKRTALHSRNKFIQFCENIDSCFFVEQAGKSYDSTKLQLSALSGIPTYIGQLQHLKTRNSRDQYALMGRRQTLVQRLLSSQGKITPSDTLLCKTSENKGLFQLINEEKCLFPASF